jgi:hypothetical protein
MLLVITHRELKLTLYYVWCDYLIIIITKTNVTFKPIGDDRLKILIKSFTQSLLDSSNLASYNNQCQHLLLPKKSFIQMQEIYMWRK